ncbi:UNVERIFIED_CONTAM: hypothetical protein NCL1_38692 [Trichonephila clavipes]
MTLGCSLSRVLIGPGRRKSQFGNQTQRKYLGESVFPLLVSYYTDGIRHTFPGDMDTTAIYCKNTGFLFPQPNIKFGCSDCKKHNLSERLLSGASNIPASFFLSTACTVYEYIFEQRNPQQLFRVKPKMTGKPKIVTSVQEESVVDEKDEDEDNNNESSKGLSNAVSFSALETAMEWYKQKSECCPTQLLLLKRIRDLTPKKRSDYFQQ